MTVPQVFSFMSLMCNRYPLPDNPSCYTQTMSGVRNGYIWTDRRITRCCPEGFVSTKCRCIPLSESQIARQDRMGIYSMGTYEPTMGNSGRTLVSRMPIRTIHRGNFYRETPLDYVNMEYNNRIMFRNPSQKRRFSNARRISPRRLFRKSFNLRNRAFTTFPRVQFRGVAEINGKKVWDVNDIILPSDTMMPSFETQSTMASYIADPSDTMISSSESSIPLTTEDRHGISFGDNRFASRADNIFYENEIPHLVLHGRTVQAGSNGRSNAGFQGVAAEVSISTKNTINSKVHQNTDRGTDTRTNTQEILFEGGNDGLQQSTSSSLQQGVIFTVTNPKRNDTESVESTEMKQGGETSNSIQLDTGIASDVVGSDAYKQNNPKNLEFKQSTQTITLTEDLENNNLRSENNLNIGKLASTNTVNDITKISKTESNISSVTNEELNKVPDGGKNQSTDTSQYENDVYALLRMLKRLKSNSGSNNKSSSNDINITVKANDSIANVSIETGDNLHSTTNSTLKEVQTRGNSSETVRTSEFTKLEKVVTITENRTEAKNPQSKELIKNERVHEFLKEENNSALISAEVNETDSTTTASLTDLELEGGLNEAVLHKAIMESETKNMPTSGDKTESFTIIRVPVPHNENSVVKGIEFKLPYKMGKLLKEHISKNP